MASAIECLWFNPVQKFIDSWRRWVIFNDVLQISILNCKGGKYTVIIIFALLTSGILISHHIFQMLMRSSIPLCYKAAYMTVYHSTLIYNTFSKFKFLLSFILST